MRLNIPEDAVPAPALTINGQEVAIVDDFKYLGAYVGSTSKDVNVRIGLAWVAFNKLKTILRAPKIRIAFKVRIFKAACVSILLYGCETWILSPGLISKLDAYATKCYRIMLCIDQKNEHVTNEELYKRVDQLPISATIRKRQLQFTGHCIRMPEDESINRFILYESRIKTNNRRGAPKTTYRGQISSYITDKAAVVLSEYEISEIASNKKIVE